ncbi:MAG: anhydro-N-acetylmuramic acid kinase [Pseudomonadota bacterium]
MKNLYIGLMSGTSMDAVDAVLVDNANISPRIIATHKHEMPLSLKTELSKLCHPDDNEINRLGEADILVGELFADATLSLLQKVQVSSKDIIAIGSHGQTIRHRPDLKFTLQIGDPNIIAARTGITTVADFRRKDMAQGGQGAPLAPAFHRVVFRSDKTDRVILNIGGIANMTVLKAKDPDFILGFDIGPGNTLMDAWINKHKQVAFDKDGQWAASGVVNKTLLNKLLAEPYFKSPAPKSTGREKFNLQWIQEISPRRNDNAASIQCTLAELTAITISDSIKNILPRAEVLVCGGGAHNNYLINRLQTLMPNHAVVLTDDVGLPADWIEAMTFAWLAKQTINKHAIDLTKITGSKQPVVLGGIYYP